MRDGEPGPGVMRARRNPDKERAGGARTGAVRDIGCGAPGARECRASSGGAAHRVRWRTRSVRTTVESIVVWRTGVEPTRWKPLGGAHRVGSTQ